MSSQKPPAKTTQQKQQSQTASGNKTKSASTTPSNKPAIPAHEVKQSSSMSAQLALEAAKKAYELRQAAYGMGDPNAREEVLAKAINKEVEAETFGKAAKYTRSGAFQGLAAGAGLGVQPGVTLGKLTGALVGGLLASVGAVVGGGIGSAYGAMSGPFWDLGQIASQGVRSIVGDFPNWEATSDQKSALEKMVMGAQQTKAPNQEELEEMRDDNGGVSQEGYQQFAQDLYSYVPNMPSMPKMPSFSSIPGFGGQSKTNEKSPAKPKTANTAASNQGQQTKAPTKPQAPPKPQSAQTTRSTPSKNTSQTAKTEPAKNASPKPTPQTTKSQPSPKVDENGSRKRPKKLEPKTAANTLQPNQPAARRPPPKLTTQRKTATANVKSAA